MQLSKNDGKGHQKELHEASREAFVDALRDKSRSTASFKTFKSTNHVVSTVDINSLSISLRHQTLHIARRYLDPS